jgi:hypothetical protein
MPAKARDSIHYCGRFDQRTGGSQAPLQLGRALAHWSRYDLIAIDEVAYVRLAEIGGVFVSGGGRTIPEGRRYPDDQSAVFRMRIGHSNARLCKALLDRIRDGAHISETSKEWYGFPRNAEK